MSGEQVGVSQVIEGLLERATNQIKLATDGAMDEQLYNRPTTSANSIACLCGISTGCRTNIISSISGDAEVWYKDRWAQQFDLPPDLPNDATGWGDSAEQAAAFQVQRATLFGSRRATSSGRLAVVSPPVLRRGCR
jgi:hypothetical protein